MPERVESLPESRQAELVLAAVDAGVRVRCVNGRWWWFSPDQRMRPLADGEPVYSTKRHAYAAAALALGLETKWRVVDKDVADEWISTTAEVNRWNRCEPSEVPEFKDRVIACRKMSAATDALARALRGEV